MLATTLDYQDTCESMSPHLNTRRSHTHTQVLHVEQEVVGDDTPVIETVLECDVERADLLREEAALMAALGITVGARAGPGLRVATALLLLCQR